MSKPDPLSAAESLGAHGRLAQRQDALLQAPLPVRDFALPMGMGGRTADMPDAGLRLIEGVQDKNPRRCAIRSDSFPPIGQNRPT